VQGYIEALLESLCPEEDGSRAMRLPAFTDLAPETFKRILEDCEAWRKTYPNVSHCKRGGASFWRLRSEQLVKRSAFPPLASYLGNDALIYFGESR